MTYRQFAWILLLFLLIISSGCGGGGGGTGGGITPPPVQTYTVSGSVSGLTGVLFLQNNGTDLLGLNTNGSFSFNKPVTSGKAYEVTIWGQPHSPVQFCVVSNGKGAATANVTGVQVTCTTPSEQVLYDFGIGDDANPHGALVFDNSGNLFGTTSGGFGAYGSVFMLTPGNGQWTETALYTFCQLPGCADGSGPSAGVVLDSAGNLYGTTDFGGTFGGGVVFELSPNGIGTWTETVLHSFGSGSDGRGFPNSGLVFDKLGNLYGTTSAGGTVGHGTVFELSPNLNGTWNESVLYNFCSAALCPDGSGPTGAVTIDATGNLYGTTIGGGGNILQWGTVFELTPGTNGQWIEQVLHAFDDSVIPDGTNPRTGVVLDTAGNLFGTTYTGYCNGSACGLGSAFEVVRGAGGQWQEKLLYGFHSGTDGIWPSGPLIIDKAGNIYGTTALGGAIGSCGAGGCGVVFALTPGPANAMWAEVPLYSFQYTDGAGPGEGLAMDAQGALYGVAGGGTNGTGVVFKVIP
jgi:uncharacterized repeat protein (TIGR03803 family)